MQLYYLRHAESTNNRLYRLTGADDGRVCDPEITDLGREQARRLAEVLAAPAAPAGPFDPQNRAGFGLTHLYCSLMARAVATGAILADRLGLPLQAWADWHEEGGVILADPATGEVRGEPGHNRAWFAQHYPALVLPDSLGEAGWWDRRPLESPEARLARAHRALAELRARHGGTADRVGVVSHGGFITHVIAALHGRTTPAIGPAATSHLLNNCAITRLDFAPDGRAEVIYQNRADFLPTELVT